MKEYNIEVLKDAANRLLLDMSEDEYKTLLSEFDIVTKQMKPLGDNRELDKLEPMVFPYEVYTTELREDVAEEPLSRDEAIRNSQRKVGGQIKLPKVVQ
jgi:aspartyl-tRNA(Asn)/glutamyl-tRNA(Gln) amidotransferase subunit C